MPNNFRLTGYCYVSKEGSDANSGLTPELPKLTVQAGLNLLTAVNRTLVIGSGVYNETIDFQFSNPLVGTISIIADGHVVLEGNSINICSFRCTGNNQTLTIFGIEFRNYLYLLLGNGNNSNSVNQIIYLNTCIVKSNVIQDCPAPQTTTLVYINSILINCTHTVLSITSTSAANYLQLSKSILINSKIYGQGPNAFAYAISSMLSTYVDTNSLVGISIQTLAANFNFNNIQGKVIMNSNGAVSGANSNGVAQTFTQHRIDYPTFNVNSISADPKFNDAQNLNFTLQSDSPHIKGANDYVSNIGGTEYAAYLKASDAEMTTGATVTNLTLQGNNSYTITSPNTTGSIVSDAKFIQWPRTKPLTKIEWVGSLEFNKSITAGTQGNQNVPDYETATSGAAASPDRLSLKMRFSTQQTKPTTSGEWDNGGYWTAGDYRLFEVNQKPKIDSNGIGNGSSSYVEFVGLGDIVPSWIQVDVILINNYNP